VSSSDMWAIEQRPCHGKAGVRWRRRAGAVIAPTADARLLTR